jgi:large subunit ribosomal protein L35
LAPGVSPAYDEALHFISSHQASLKRRITELQSSPSSAIPETAAVIESLTVASQINDPQVRWAFENTAEDDLDLKSPVVRHLRERAWRKCGSLDKLVSGGDALQLARSVRR